MKRLLLIIFTVLLCFCMSSVCMAQGEAGSTEVATLYTRLQEFWVSHKTEIIQILAEVGSLISLAILTIKKFKSNGQKLDVSTAQTNAVYNSQKKLDESNKLVENAVGRLDTTEQLIKEYTEQSKVNLEQMVKICLNTQEMLITVCSRSKDIPSQVKDLIDVKYIESVKLSKGETGAQGIE